MISWMNRGTLHLVASDDFPWLRALTAPTMRTGTLRRLTQEGISGEVAERAVAVIGRSIDAEGPLTRHQLGERRAAAAVPTQGQALVHLLVLASLRGLIVRGPMVDGRHAFVLASEWLGEPAPVARSVALGELARRDLAGHGPAHDFDLVTWAGLPLRDARTGLRSIASELEERPDGLVDLATRGASSALPPPRLLGPFDPLLMGWQSREAVLGSHTGVVTVNGIFRPFALAEGRAVGTWTMPQGAVVFAPFGALAPRTVTALAVDAADVVRFLGTPIRAPMTVARPAK